MSLPHVPRHERLTRRGGQPKRGGQQTKGDCTQNSMIENLVRLTRLEKVYGHLPGADGARFAALLGLDEAAYRGRSKATSTRTR